MARLLHRVTNQTDRCLAQRPSRDDFHGLNHDSIQAIGLAAWWPLWEPMSPTQKCPPAMDHGPNQLNMVPSVNTLHVGEAQMGNCWFGSVTPANVTGLRSWQAHSRPYANGVAGAVDPVDFGALPNASTIATAYMSTSWIKTDEDARRFRNGAPLDAYIYTFDRNDGFGFPGHTLGLITRQQNQPALPVFEAAATMFDNDDAGQVPFGVQHLQAVNDGYWHLICGLYVPLGATNNHGDGVQIIMVDGEIGFVGGIDDATGNQIRFGNSFQQVDMGSPQSAAHASSTAVTQFIGSDDDGVSSSFPGYLGDHRLYSYDNYMSGKGKGLDIVEFALQQARHMYHPETRWELYRSRTPKGSSQAIVQTGATDTCHLVTTGGWVY